MISVVNHTPVIMVVMMVRSFMLRVVMAMVLVVWVESQLLQLLLVCLTCRSAGLPLCIQLLL